MYTSMFRKAMLGDTATLALDFSAGTLPTAVTFTRADSTARATFIDASGYVKTVATAGAARFDYTGGVAKGLLIEASATNLVNYSTGLSQNPWYAVVNVTLTVNLGGTAPDGTNNTATRISMAGAIGGASSLYYNGVATTNQTYTHSVYAKAGTTNWLYLWTETSGSVAYGAYFELTGSGTVGNLVGSGTTAKITPCLNDWYRCETTSTQPIGTAFPCMLPSTANLTGRASMVGTTPGNLFIWGDQFEAGSRASSFIHTTTASLLRLADDAVIRSTAWTSLFSKPGSLVVQYYRGEYGAGDRSVLAIDTAATKHMHLKHANASAVSGVYDSAGLSVASKMTGNTTGLNKAAFNWSSANPSAIRYVINGGTLASGTSDIGATLGTWMTIGSASTTGVSGSGTWEGYLNNSIKSVKYYSELLSDAEMIAKTT